MKAGPRDRSEPGDEAYEQDTLAAVRQLLTRSAPNLARWQKRVLDVRLEGTRPDTRLVVDYWDDHANEQRSRAFALWTRNRDSGEIEPEDAPGSWAIIVRENIEVPPGV
jgi:hypothetical protein